MVARRCRDRASEPSRATAPLCRGSCEHLENRNLAPRSVCVQIRAQGFGQCGDAELVEPERACQRVPTTDVDRAAATDDESGLRAAEQLVPAEHDDIGPGCNGFLNGR